jgi:hypothetical protein
LFHGGDLMTQAQRLRNELLQKTVTGTFGEQDRVKLREKLGSLVINALDDEHHPLAEELEELKAMIDCHRAKPQTPQPAENSETASIAAPKTAVMSDANLFMPHPGISLPIRRFWRLQLLLYEAVCSSAGAALAGRLNLDMRKIAPHLEAARKASTGYWSIQQYAGLMAEALAFLDYPEPPLRLDGTMLRHRGHGIRLSKLQVKFVELLIENRGKWVDRARFAARGISDPVKVLHAVKQKADSNGITLPIDSKAGAYKLANDT